MCGRGGYSWSAMTEVTVELQFAQCEKSWREIVYAKKYLYLY